MVVVLRRKPAKLFHVLRWDTERDEIESGSWFHGRIYEMRSDVSFDGRFMVYLATGQGNQWTGVCRPPYLKAEIAFPNIGTWHGGGVFTAADRLMINPGHAADAALGTLVMRRQEFPFDFEFLDNIRCLEDEGVLYPRLERDGFRRVGPMPPEERVEGRSYTLVCRDDPGWVLRPTEGHPELRVRYRGYRQGRIFEWDLPELPGVLDPQVSWAVYDSLGQLIVARRGVLYRYTLSDLLAGKPSSVFDLEPLEKPRFGDSETAP